MKKLFLAITVGMSLILAACNSQEPIKLTIEKYRVVDIPATLYDRCPDVNPKLPKWQTLTDRQVAQLIVTLYRNNKECRAAILAIKNFVETAKSELDNKPIY